jgi:hypothetical protein
MHLKRDKWLALLSLVSSICLLAVVLDTAVNFLFFTIQALAFPYPLDYGEAPIIDQAIRLAAGQNIYRSDLSHPPYTISNYPPVYISFVALFVKYFGPNFWSGRLISIISSLVSAGLIGMILYTLSHSKLAAFVSGGVFLSIPFVVYWSSLGRVDLLGLALSLGGLWILLKISRRKLENSTASVLSDGTGLSARAQNRSLNDILIRFRRYEGLIVGCILLVGAVFTRQTYGLAAPLTALALFLLNRRWKTAFIFFTGFALLGAGGFLCLNALTRGGFSFNLIRANINQMNGIVTFPIYIVLFASLMVVAMLLFSRPWFRPWAVVGFYLIGGTLSALTVGKVGSNVNYFLEWFAGFAMLEGVLVSIAGKDTVKSTLVASLLTIQLVWLLFSSQQVVAPTLRFRTNPQAVAQVQQMEALIRQANGPIVADEFMGLETLENRQLYFQPFEMTQLARSGLWDQSGFLSEIAEHKFALILISTPNPNLVADRWTPEMLQAISLHYQKVERIGFTDVYMPEN